jgi:hypothetical protein
VSLFAARLLDGLAVDIGTVGAVEGPSLTQNPTSAPQHVPPLRRHDVVSRRPSDGLSRSTGLLEDRVQGNNHFR